MTILHKRPFVLRHGNTGSRVLQRYPTGILFQYKNIGLVLFSIIHLPRSKHIGDSILSYSNTRIYIYTYRVLFTFLTKRIHSEAQHLNCFQTRAKTSFASAKKPTFIEVKNRQCQLCTNLDPYIQVLSNTAQFKTETLTDNSPFLSNNVLLEILFRKENTSVIGWFGSEYRNTAKQLYHFSF